MSATESAAYDEKVQEALTASFEEARRGSIVVHNVVGPPGVGKTRLVDTWLDRVRVRALRTWIPHVPASTFRPVADVVERAAGIDRSDPMDVARSKLTQVGDLNEEVIRRLAHLVGERGSVFANHELFWAMRSFFACLSRGESLIVVWEGLERAGPTFLDMLEYLAGREASVMVLTTGREEVTRARPHWIGEPASLRSTLFAGSGDGRPELFTSSDSLDTGERAALQTAAVLGEAVEVATLVAAAPPDCDEVESSIARLVERGALVHRPAAAREDMTFASGELRDVVREQVPDRFAAGVHERFASYLERAADKRVALDEVIAFHLESALEHCKGSARRPLVDRAVGRLSRAGRRALERSDAPAAVDLLERGAVLIDDADTRRPRLLLSLCDALLDLGDVQRIRRIAETGLQEAREVGDDLAAARFDVWRQIALARLRPEEERVDLGEELRVAAMMEREGEHLGAAEAYQLYAEHVWDALDYMRAEEALEKALSNAQSASHARLTSKIAAWLMFSFFWGPRPTPTGIDRCESFANQFSADRLLEASRLTTLGGLHGLAGDLVRARELIGRARDLQVELGQPLVISWNPQIGATIALVNGDLKGAEADARLAFEEARHMADPGHAATGASLLAKVLYEQDRLEEAFQYTRLAERASVGGPESAQAEWRCTRAKLDARRGNVERGVATIKGALDFLDGRAM
ncbi:MAG: AAA family ATPase, partial [Actinomycetota bacterium]|nr:AAA family ATPase [Actinomycetota bacterium]